MQIRNNNKTPLYTPQDGYIKKQNPQNISVGSVGEDVEKPFCIAAKNAKMIQPLWKTAWWFLKKIKHRIDI